jgi:Zn-dependent peptidase ImmA (M78 family)
MPKVNPEILVWARKTAGLSREEAIRKLGIRDAWGIKAVDRLSSLESGETDPTRPTLVKMAKQYRRPLVTFYLSKPPQKGDRGADFRTLPSEPDPAANALLDALIRDVQARQSMVRAALEDEEEAEPLKFIGSRRIQDGRGVVLDSLKKTLDVSLSEYHSQPNASSAFDLLRASAGRAGVFVLLKGDLGNYLTAIYTEIFRGLSSADEIAPFVVINDRDAVAAWSFTLLHELVHLILGQTGVGSFRVDNNIERFCNDVAGDFLLPERDVKAIGLKGAHSIKDRIEWIDDFARRRNLSRAMVTYRAYRSDEIEREDYETLASHFRQQWQQERTNRRERARNREVKIDYYVIRRHRIGNELIALVSRMMDSGSLTTAKAAKILGVKLSQVQPLFDISAQ